MWCELKKVFQLQLSYKTAIVESLVKTLILFDYEKSPEQTM